MVIAAIGVVGGGLGLVGPANALYPVSLGANTMSRGASYGAIGFDY